MILLAVLMAAIIGGALGYYGYTYFGVPGLIVGCVLSFAQGYFIWGNIINIILSERS